jgi:hypothetical protein
VTDRGRKDLRGVHQLGTCLPKAFWMEGPKAVISLASVLGTECGLAAKITWEVSPAVIESEEVKDKCLCNLHFFILFPF